MIMSPGLAASIADWMVWPAASTVGRLPPTVTVTVSTDCLPLAAGGGGGAGAKAARPGAGDAPGADDAPDRGGGVRVVAVGVVVAFGEGGGGHDRRIEVPGLARHERQVIAELAVAFLVQWIGH